MGNAVNWPRDEILEGGQSALLRKLLAQYGTSQYRQPLSL
jgi:hypothetical protein